MARPKSSTKSYQCHGCGERYTKAFFDSNPVVCNICMLGRNEIPPDDLPFSPEALKLLEPPPPPPPPPPPDPLASVTLANEIETFEIAERVLMQRSMLATVQRFKPDYKAGWVHIDICRRLERFMHDVEEGKSPRLLLCMPPRHGKSCLTSNFFPPWVLGHHPEWEIIAASHTQALALKFSGFIRDLIRDPAYTATFPKTLLNPESQAKDAWDTTKRGGYLAAGVGTGITGRGAHILIIDDPVKDMEAADSATIRDSIWEWYASTAYTRLAPGGGVLGILTLWNEDDWGSRIIEISDSGDGDRFEVVRYAAINDGYAEYLDPDERTIVHVEPDAAGEYPHPGPAYKLLRNPGEALHPERYTLKDLLRIKKNYFARGNQRVWSALYQQKPTPEDGVYFTKGMFKYYSVAPSRRFRTVYQAWDFAITEQEKNDYIVGSTLLQDENDYLYVLDVKRFRSDDSIEIVEAMLDYYVLWGADLVGVEDGQIWKTMKAQWEKRCAERHLYPSYEVLQPLTDKRVRAMPLRGRMQLGRVLFPSEAPWLEVCRKEMLTFPAGKHDDQVDSIAWNVRLTLTHVAPVIPQPQNKLGSWRDKLKHIDTSSHSHMAA